MLRHHPRGLPFLFLTEMWERFGFYVVQGLLVLYMTKHFGFSDNKSYTILGVFTALAYISPIVGGILADKLLGFKAATLYGGACLILGYTLLALPTEDILFYPGLATIIVGTGLFKPNISSLLGSQYQRDDPRREAGFTIFYIGINLGAVLAGTTSGYIKEFFGWRMSFAVASVGLVIALMIFTAGIKHMKDNASHLAIAARFKWQWLVYVLMAVIGISFLLKLDTLTDWLLPAVGIVLIVFLTRLTLKQQGEDRKKIVVLNTLILSSIVFWMIYWQMFFSANLFIDRLVDKTIFGFPITTTVFYASESIFIILLGPLFALLWQVLANKQKNPSSVSKFIAGIFLVGVGFLLLGSSTFYPMSNNLINPFWVFASYFFITVGELLLSPIGLSAVTMLSPPRLVGMMMGVWFVATGFGGIFAGMIAKLASVPDTAVTVAEKLSIYQSAFFDYAYLAFFVAIGLFFVQMAMKHLLRKQ
jgi:POT family proton-dependent oligopeptide transporter